MAMSHVPIIHILHSRVALDLAPLKPSSRRLESPLAHRDDLLPNTPSASSDDRLAPSISMHTQSVTETDARRPRQWRCVRGHYKGAMMPHESTVSRPEASATGTR